MLPVPCWMWTTPAGAQPPAGGKDFGWLGRTSGCHLMPLPPSLPPPWPREGHSEPAIDVRGETHAHTVTTSTHTPSPHPALPSPFLLSPLGNPGNVASQEAPPAGGRPERTSTSPHLTLHSHHHTSCRHRQTPGFLREKFSSPGGGRSTHPLDPKPCFISPINLSDSPLAEENTSCLPPPTQETPSVPPGWSVRPSSPPAASSRCWSRPDVSLDIRPDEPPRCCRRGGRGLSDRTTTPLPPPITLPPH